MAGFSFWHLAPVMPIILGVIGVALNRSEAELARGPFFLRVAVLFVIAVAMAALIDEESDTALVVAMIYIGAIWILIPFWAVARLRHMGIAKKYWAVLSAVPVIGVFYTIYLMAAAGAAEENNPPRSS